MIAKKTHLIAATAGMFILGLVGAVYFYEESTTIATISLLGGLALSILFVIPILGQSSKGKVVVNNEGVEIEWDVRQKDPIYTISSPNPTNSTESEKAEELCQKGRDILNGKSGDEAIDIAEAFKYFSEAAEIDDGYWEPRANIAGILVIKGQLEDAFKLASEIRALAGDNSLAYANGSLIMASSIETSIDPESSPDIINEKYSLIVNILDESLQKNEKDIVVRAAKIKSKIFGNYEKDDVEHEIKEGIKYLGFREEFSDVLNKDDILKVAFVAEYPKLAVHIFPTA